MKVRYWFGRSLVLSLLWIVGALSVYAYPVAHVSAASLRNAPLVELSENVCPEGQYFDLTTDYCRNLDKNFGFDSEAFLRNWIDQEYTLTECSADALADLLERKGDKSGRVTLPACTLEIDDTIDLPSNTILEGAGRDKTILKARDGFDENMVLIKGEENVIVRDMGVDGDGSADRGVFAWYSSNILMERLHVHHMDRSGIQFRYTEKITIRYSESHDNREFHGIVSKDCFDEDLSGCKDSAGDVGPGALWSQDYAIYSNRLYNNGTYGLDSHASYGEVAGNLIYDNEYGTKFPDTSHVWIHRNRIEDNEKWGTYVYPTMKIEERYPHNVVFYENEFLGNGEYPLMVRAPVKNLYLLMNQYDGNDPNALRIDDVPVYTCSDSPDAKMDVSGTDVKYLEPAQCDLASIAHLFGQDADAPGGTVPEAPPTDSQPPDPQDPNPQEPDSDAPFRIAAPGRIEAEEYREGGAGVGYYDTTEGNAGGAYRSQDVDIMPLPGSNSAYAISWTEPGEWLAYDIDVVKSAQYRIIARVAAGGSGERSLYVEVDGQNVSGSMQFNAPTAQSNGNVWIDLTSSPVQLSPGAHEIRVVFETGGIDLDFLNIVGESSDAPDDDGDGDGGQPEPTTPVVTNNIIFLPVIKQ